MKYLTIRSLLLNAGLLLLLIGTAVLFYPVAFFEANGSTLGNVPSLLSEIRAYGGLLIGCSFVVLLGVFQQRFSQTALLLATTVYLSVGISRLTSFLFDGLPSSTLVGSTIVELCVGALCAASLRHLNSKHKALAERHSIVRQEAVPSN